VQLDGKKGVLMTVLKARSASTLDIIAGIKELLPRIQETLPPGVELKIVNDQSGFVKASVFSVIREGVIAAALTGLMILLFLGSWRSTLIISISIPLSILAALPILSALGETINVMTIGRGAARPRRGQPGGEFHPRFAEVLDTIGVAAVRVAPATRAGNRLLGSC
jgi:multidrug efflux pump subunit AcrB